MAPNGVNSIVLQTTQTFTIAVVSDMLPMIILIPEAGPEPLSFEGTTSSNKLMEY